MSGHLRAERTAAVVAFGDYEIGAGLGVGYPEKARGRAVLHEEVFAEPVRIRFEFSHGLLIVTIFCKYARGPVQRDSRGRAVPRWREGI